MSFTPSETIACRRLVELALQEDVGAGDLTSQAVIPPTLEGRAVFVARAAGVPAGLPAAALVFATLDPACNSSRSFATATPCSRAADWPGSGGPMRAILSGERTRSTSSNTSAASRHKPVAMSMRSPA